MWEHLLPRKQLRCKATMAAEPPSMLGASAQRLTQVLFNTASFHSAGTSTCLALAPLLLHGWMHLTAWHEGRCWGIAGQRF